MDRRTELRNLVLGTVSFLGGMAGSSFAVGVVHVARWTPPERQGTALGLYGLGTMGQSAAVFLGPALADRVGLPAVFRGLAALLEKDRLECPCHEGYFDARSGRVLQGPPQRPLPRIVLERRGDRLFASGVDLQKEG